MNGAITTEFDPAAEPERLAQLMPAIQGYAVTGAGRGHHLPRGKDL